MTEKKLPEVKIETETKKETSFSSGYKASMRHLLTLRPTMEANGMEHLGNGFTRPTSANIISRPGTAVRLGSAVFSPRPGSSPAGAPYLSNNRPYSPRPSSTVPMWPQPDKTTVADLYQKVAEEADRQENKEAEEEKKEKPIEEIRLVKAAVKAFKRRKNLKKAKERKSKRLENLVDQILRQRRLEVTASANSTAAAKQQQIIAQRRRDSRSSESSKSANSSSGSRGPLLGPDGRPESVATRVMRQRQERKIRTKLPRRPPTSFSTTQSATAASKPLHLALRAASAKHGSKQRVKESIKQQVHFNAVKSYKAPRVIVNNNDNDKVKSILKKQSKGQENDEDRRRVNYSFDKVSSEDNQRIVKAEVYTISS